jgi:hypothetical protein
MGGGGLEPPSLAAQDPKSCVSANFTTRPTCLLSNTYVCIRMLLLDVFASVCAIISAEQTSL